MGILLRLKHWQIFLMTFGVALVSVCLVFFVSHLISSPLVFRFILFLTTVGFVIASCWLYMVGVEFNKRIPAEQATGTDVFRNCVYIVIAMNVLSNIVFPTIKFHNQQVQLFLTVTSLGCNIYVNYFAAKMLATTERQRALSFGDFAGDFFAFIFFPIGIWFLQPRINRIVNDESSPVDPDAPLDQGVR